MPEVGLDRAFLHRCCIQMSSALADDAVVAAETHYTLRFVCEHAHKYPGEVTRALVWRIVDTDDDEVQDRLGAWTVLNAVLAECADSNQHLSSTAVAEKISLFLPYIILYRWYSLNSAEQPAVTTNSKSKSVLLSSYGKVVPASALTGVDSRLAEVKKVQEIQSKYRAFLATWKVVWRHDVYQRFKSAVRQVERNGNNLLAKDQPYLDIPATFRDSLRRLRRRNPRPSMAFHVLSCYGWVPPEDNAETIAVNGNNKGDKSSTICCVKRGAAVPTSMTEIDKLDKTAHPRVRQWLQKLVETGGGCCLCDVWQHKESHCPCELPFIKTPITEYNNQFNYCRRRVECLSMTYSEAVEKLSLYGIRLPLSVEKVLDRIVSLIKDELPYDELIDAFDTVRGAVTGPLERHALWLHASYMLMPSRTVFDKPSDDALSSAMEKAENYFKLNRRFREWDQLLQSVDVLDSQYRRAELPQHLLHSIEEVRDTKSFFFCLIDGSLSVEYVPSAYARVPIDVEQLRHVKDVLCPVCLEPFHVAARCKQGTEFWDLSVARIVLEEHDLLHMKYPDDFYKLDSAFRIIDEDDRKEKEFRKNELRLAVKLVHEFRVPYCKFCNIMGHSARRCEDAARKVLKQLRIEIVDMRLNPNLVQLKIKELREARDGRMERALTDAWELLGKGQVYPDSFLGAIRELEDAHIPLAAARYSTDAVQGFLLFVKSNDLLQHLQPLRDERFPDVCLFCDSYHHGSELCERAHAEERGFLSELRCYGLTLWQYLCSPEHYDECFPTDYPKGRETVVGLARQFQEDYSPGGIARVRFLEDNGLGVNYSGGGGQSRVGSTGLVYGSQSYGMSFSQLIFCPAANGVVDYCEGDNVVGEHAAAAVTRTGTTDGCGSQRDMNGTAALGLSDRFLCENGDRDDAAPATPCNTLLGVGVKHGGKRGREEEEINNDGYHYFGHSEDADDVAASCHSDEKTSGDEQGKSKYHNIYNAIVIKKGVDSGVGSMSCNAEESNNNNNVDGGKVVEMRGENATQRLCMENSIKEELLGVDK